MSIIGQQTTFQYQHGDQSALIVETNPQEAEHTVGFDISNFLNSTRVNANKKSYEFFAFFLAGFSTILALRIYHYQKQNDIEQTNSSMTKFLFLIPLLIPVFLIFSYKKLNQYRNKKIEFNPPVKNENYVHRESSRKLYSLLDDPSQILPIIFYGEEGEGKTEVMLNYIHNQHNRDTYWFNSENSTILKEHLHIFLVNKNLLKYDQPTDEEIGAAFNEWRKSFPNDLCIFDNLVFSTQTRNWLAFPDKVNSLRAKVVCIVSSDLDCFTETGFLVIAIEKMLPEESQNLLEKHSGINCENELDQANNLIIKLDNLPLIIVSAGNYIKQNNYSYVEFLKFFKKNKKSVLQKKPNERHVSAWVMFEAHFNKLNESQKILLQYACCLSKNNIPRSLLSDIVKYSESEINEDLLILLKKGLLHPDDKNHFKMHTIFRGILQSNIIENEKLYVKLLNRIFEFLYNQLNRGNVQFFLPHIHSLADMSNKGVISNQSKDVVKIFEDIFYLYSIAHQHNSNQDKSKQNTYSIFSGVNIAMRGVKSKGKVAELVSKHVIKLFETFIDVKKIPFSKDSYRSNIAIAYMKLSTIEKISTYILLKEIDNFLECGIITEISNRQICLFKAHSLLFLIHILPLHGAEEYFQEQIHHIYTTTKENLEMYKKRLIIEFEFSDKSEVIILINSFLAAVYREAAIRLNNEDKVLYELEKSIQLFEEVISDIKSYKVADDYILLLEIKLELATSLKRLLQELNKQLKDKNKSSVETLTLYEKTEKSYNSLFPHTINCLKAALPKNSDLVVKFNAIHSEKLLSFYSVTDIDSTRNNYQLLR